MHLSLLTNLVELQIIGNDNITDEGLINLLLLTNLTFLNLEGCFGIVDRGLSVLSPLLENKLSVVILL